MPRLDVCHCAIGSFKLCVSYQFLFMKFKTILLCLISKAGRRKHRMCGKMRLSHQKGRLTLTMAQNITEIENLSCALIFGLIDIKNDIEHYKMCTFTIFIKIKANGLIFPAEIT